MLAVFTAAYVVAERLTPDDIPNIIAIYLQNAEVVKALGYSYSDAASEHLTQSIFGYINLPLRQWHTPIWNRINFIPIPDKKLSARLLVGCIKLSQNIASMTLVLREQQL
jgi:hypothetical protein